MSGFHASALVFTIAARHVIGLFTMHGKPTIQLTAIKMHMTL